MLRGHVGSIELIRGILNPYFRRNLTAASVRYADDKDRKKADGVFSWLKDIFKADARAHEDRNAIDREATVTVLDYPKYNQASLINFTLEDVADSSVVRKFPDSAQSCASTSFDVRSTTKFLDDLANHHLIIGRRKSSYDSTSAAGDADVYSADSTSLAACQKLRSVPEVTDSSIRTIMSCKPRNTKTPIREPNMPEKREKKDDKKERKKKKPVIHTNPSNVYRKDASSESETKLHDNLDVNFRHLWAIRLSEDDERVVKQSWSNGLQHLQSPTLVGDANYSSFQASSDSDGLQEIRDVQLTMSSEKDSINKADSKSEIGKIEECCSKVAKSSEEIGSLESLKRILKTPPSLVEGATDEEYSVPTGTTFDAEVSAWKDLVLKSKVPLSPPKEEFLQEDAGSRVEMLSIRPEPPEPKLDVQSVRSMEDSYRDEEDEAELSKDYKSSGKPMDLRRSGGSSDSQKIDSKKLHTGALYVLGGVDGSRGTSRFRSSMLMSAIVGKNVSGDRSEFSTSSKSRWARMKEQLPTGEVKTVSLPEAMHSPDDRAISAETTRVAAVATEPHQQQLASRQQPNQAEDDDFADSLNAIAEREIEIAINRPQQEDQESGESPIAVSTQRKLDGEEHQLTRPDDFHGSLNYASPYEDDYFPSFDSATTEPIMEKPAPERKPQPQASTIVREESRPEARESYELEAEGIEHVRNDFTVDGDYVKVPGDPYPYSREHFQKWRLAQRDIPIGRTYDTADFLSNPTSSEADPTLDMEIPQTQGEEDSTTSHSLHLANPHDSPAPAGSMPGIEGDNKDAEMKKRSELEDDLSSHVETIQPNPTSPVHGVSGNYPRSYARKTASNLVRSPKPADVMLGEKQKELANKEGSAHMLRQEQLSTVSKQEIAEIYELKNYTYLRPEQMKNLRFTVPSNPDANDPESSPPS